MRNSPHLLSKEYHENSDPSTTDSTATIFHQLVPDCRKLVLSYHFYFLQDLDLPSHLYSRTKTPESLSELQFALENFYCQANLEQDAFYGDLPLLCNLSSLDLSDRRYFFDRLDIFSHFHHLVELHIFDYGSSFRDEIFQDLGSSLEVLAITGHLRVERSLTDALFTHLKRLRQLMISECDSFTDHAIENLYNAGSRLQKLQISKCNQMTDQAFSYIQGEALTELKLWYCEHINGEGLQHVRGVESLVLGGMEPCNSCKVFQCLEGSVQTLHILYSRTISLDKKAMSYLKGISTLKLHMVNIENLTDASFSPLAGSIKNLEVSGCQGTEGLSKNMLWHLSGIERVVLYIMPGIRIEAKDLPGLKRVFGNVSWCKLDEEFADETTMMDLREFVEGNGGAFNRLNVWGE